MSIKNLTFNWNAGIQSEAKQAGETLSISGELVNASVCANNFALDETELPKLVDQLKDATLRVDHSKSARDVIGGFTNGKYDKINKRILFEAEVDDPAIQRSIVKGRLKYISIGASAEAYCSKCGKPTKPVKTCKCKEAYDIIRNIKLKEASIITEPAYQSSQFQPLGFIASISSALDEFVTASTDSSEKEEGGEQKNKNLEEKGKMSQTQIEATTLKPAGDSSVVLLGEKLEGVMKRLESLETRFKKQDEEDEAKKKKDEEDERKKKEGETFTKLEQAITKLETKLDEAIKVKVKKEPPCPEEKKESEEDEEDEGKKKKEDEDEDEEGKKKKKEGKKKDEDEEDEGKKKKDEDEDEGKKKEAKPLKGAKVESAEGTVEVNTSQEPQWWREVTAAAKKMGVLD